MSVFSNEIDLNIVEHLIETEGAALKRETLYELLQATQAWQRNEPQADQFLCQLIAENPDLDRAYTKALADVRKGYVSQERAKNAILIPNQPFTDRENWTNSLIPKLEKLLLKPIPTIPNSKSNSIWDNLDRLLVMGTGGAFLGGAFVQLLGGGSFQLVGAIVGALFGIIAGIYVSRPAQPRHHS